MASSLLRVLFVVVTLLVATAAFEVDKFTLAKLVGGHNNVFVQVTEHSWDQVKDWEQAEKEFLETPDVLVTTVVTSDDLNSGFDDKYGVKAHPSFLFFAKGSSTPDVYTGAEDAEEAFDFLKSKLAPELRELQSLAAKFASSKDKAALLAKAQAVVAKMDNFKQTGEIFVKTMQRVQEKGADFVSKEHNRLSSLTENTNTVEKQKRDFRKRLAVLRSFQHDLA